MGDTWEDTIKKLVKQYFEGDPFETESAMEKIKPMKYNKKYFDDFEEEVNPKKVISPTKTSKK